MALLILMGQVGNSQHLSATQDKDGILVTEKGDKLLYYQLSTVDLDGQYPRANYLHPVYGIDGEVLTEDFPKDHLHQRGVFWAWHQLYVKGQSVGDPWETKNVEWVNKSAEIKQSSKKAITLEAATDLLTNIYPNSSSPKAVVREHSVITIYKTKKNYRIIDVELGLQALVEGVEIGGSDNEKGYGGFSVRMKMPEDILFTAKEGVIEPVNLAMEAGKWVDVSGSLAVDGGNAGIVMIQSKDNPLPNDKWILRKRTSMQNPVWPGQHRIALSQDGSTVLKYRLIVYKGDLSAKKIEKIAKNF